MKCKCEQEHWTARKRSSPFCLLLNPSSAQECPRPVCNRSNKPRAQLLPNAQHSHITLPTQAIEATQDMTTGWHFSGPTHPTGALFWSERWELKSIFILQTVKSGFYNETEDTVSFIFKLQHLGHTYHWDDFLRNFSFGLCYHLLLWLNPEIFAVAETPFLTSKTMNIFLGVSITWYKRQMCWWLRSFMASISNLTRGKSS